MNAFALQMHDSASQQVGHECHPCVVNVNGWDPGPMPAGVIDDNVNEFHVNTFLVNNTLQGPRRVAYGLGCQNQSGSSVSGSRQRIE